MSDPRFWDDSEKSTRVVKELKSLKALSEPWDNAFKKYQELKELVDILKDEDNELISSLSANIDNLLNEIDKLEFKALLGGGLDRNSAILSINAGAGGTESCDWVGMLLRMYMRFAEAHGWASRTIDMLAGEEAEIKKIGRAHV